MKYKMIKNICRKKYYGMVTAVSVGMFTIITFVCVCGLCMTKVDIPDIALYAVTCFILAMGGYISGVSIGKNKRKNGILSGLKSGIWIWGIVSVFGTIYMREFIFFTVVKDLPIVCIPAVIGGIYGVNTKIKRPPL